MTADVTRWVVCACHAITSASGPVAARQSTADAPIVVVLAADHDAAILAERAAVLVTVERVVDTLPCPYSGRGFSWMAWQAARRRTLAAIAGLRRPEPAGGEG